MNKRIKIFIIFWFVFSWLIIVGFSLKYIGITNTLKQIFNSLFRYMFPPKSITLCDFETPQDFTDWRWKDVFMEPSSDYVYRGNYSAKITYYASSPLASLILENYDIGPKGYKDWSFFKFFKFVVINPSDKEIPLHIKIKDISAREIERVFYLKDKENKITLELEEIGQFVDLTQIVYLNFYLTGLKEDTTIYLDALHLERGDLKEKRILNKPVINLIKINLPKETKKQKSFTLSFWLSTSKELKYDYNIFVHISYFKEINKKPIERKYYINADQLPSIPTSQWKVNFPYEIGPLNIFIPKEFPAGEYFIQIGLFNPQSHGTYYKYSSYKGMLDFRSGFARLNYTDPKIKNFIVGKIKVLD